jgi:hypothetical protein
VLVPVPNYSNPHFHTHSFYFNVIFILSSYMLLYAVISYKKLKFVCLTSSCLPRLANIWHACPKWQAKRFPWHATFTAIPIFLFIDFTRPASLYCEEYVYTYAHLTPWILYMNFPCYQIILQVKHFNTNREQCEWLTGCLTEGCRPGGDWASRWHWTKSFTILFSKWKW